MTTALHTNNTIDYQPRRTSPVANLDRYRRQVRETSKWRQPKQTEEELRQELSLAFSDLGGATFALARQGTLNDQQLAPRVRRIEELYAQLGALADTVGTRAA